MGKARVNLIRGISFARLFIPWTLLSASFLIGGLSFPAEDELQKNLQEQSTAGQENKPKE